ncbi:MAG TPA: crossover junction endodeoxyribonuclease RuvC [Candidatus Limnocylindrales bacterium]
MIILGIDPGTAALGFGIVERTGARLRVVDYGCLETSPDLPLPDRLAAVHGCLTELIELHSPDLLGVERLFFTRNAQTAFAVGQARGVVLLAAAQHGVPVREATPNEVKVAVAGHGGAAKDQVQRMVQAVLGMQELPTPDDAADALAVAICVANRERSVARLPVGALDRSAVSPGQRGETPFDRAVREALRRERALGRAPATTGVERTPPAAVERRSAS